MNNVVLVGRLVRDPYIMVSDTAEACTIASFTLAVNNPHKPDSADFIECKSFGKTAETIELYVTKGTKIVLSGSMHSYQYDKDGSTRYGIEVLVNSFEFCEKKEEKKESEQKSKKQTRGKSSRK